jgi:clan AA aspartic protease
MTHYGRVSEIDDILEAETTLLVQGDGDTTENIDFIIDTGYTGELTLPQDIIDRLNLQAANYDESDVGPTAVLADGAIRTVTVYVATILWNDRLRNVEVDSLGIAPLIGMRLLRGCNLSINAAPGGRVAITELSDTFC